MRIAVIFNYLAHPAVFFYDILMADLRGGD